MVLQRAEAGERQKNIYCAEPAYRKLCEAALEASGLLDAWGSRLMAQFMPRMSSHFSTRLGVSACCYSHSLADWLQPDCKEDGPGRGNLLDCRLAGVARMPKMKP